MKRKKATREQVREHNRKLVLNAVYTELADNRAAIANETGLAKPTVSELTAFLIDDGFLIEDGIGTSTSTGGKPPRILRFVPESRQVIGVATDGETVYGMLTDLYGKQIAAHRRMVQDNLLESLTDVINGLVAQLTAPLMCMGMAMPGKIDREQGVVLPSQDLNLSEPLPLMRILQDIYDVPVYMSNNTELAAIGYRAYDSERSNRNLVMVRIGHDVEIAVALRGRYHHGGALGQIPVAGQPLNAVLAWDNICARVDELREYYPETILPPRDELSFLHIIDAYRREDMAALILYNRMADTLAYLFAWIVGLVQPDDIVLAGRIANMGNAFLDDVRERLQAMLPDAPIDTMQISLSETTRLSTRGAVAHAIERELGIM